MRWMKLAAAGLSDVGQERDHNEDSYAVEEALGLFIVADGMGGHLAGEVASAMAIACVVEHLTQHSGGDRVALLAEATRLANTRVIEEGQRNRKRRGMGSTFVALVRDGDDAGIVHVGDSRCYRYRHTVLERLTRDHSLIEEYAGDDPIARAALGNYSNMITRAIGTGAEVEPEVRRDRMQPGDIYLLCSDGLCGVVKDSEVAAVLGRGNDLPDRARDLVRIANEHGGPDNISVGLVRVDP